MKHIYIKAGAILAVLFLHGCCSERASAVPQVRDVGPNVVTKYRYRLSHAYSLIYSEDIHKDIHLKDDILAKYQPRAFSSAGIPVVLRIKYNKMDVEGEWSTLIGMCTIGLIPDWTRYSYFFDCSIEMADAEDGKSTFEIACMTDHASTWVPTAFLFFNGEASVDGRRVFSQPTRRVGGDKGPSAQAMEYKPEKRLSNDRTFRQALAYAVAVKLKELEDSGKIDAMLRKKVENRSAAPAHSVVQLDRDAKDGFAYSFAIEFAGTPSDFKSAARAVLQDFSKSVKDEYLDTFPSADVASLVVSFSGLKREGLRISGRAAVLTIKPTSLTYDANTRRGKMAVKFGVGQAEEARAWIHRNIKTLARDKNIALTTGQVPPAATYYSLGEKVEGNIMEIEFKTE